MGNNNAILSEYEEGGDCPLESRVIEPYLKQKWE
jgi:hypothetical protein